MTVEQQIATVPRTTTERSTCGVCKVPRSRRATQFYHEIFVSKVILGNGAAATNLRTKCGSYAKPKGGIPDLGLVRLTELDWLRGYRGKSVYRAPCSNRPTLH